MKPDISVVCDPLNPGQFFACCGLFELADRLWPGAEAWFEHNTFHIGAPGGNLTSLLTATKNCPLKPLDEGAKAASPLSLGKPFGLRLDWWKDTRSGGAELKVWAGSMSAPRIAHAMQRAVGKLEMHGETLFRRGMVVYDPSKPKNKVEPFYFDSRRGNCAHPLDVGFSPDPVQMTVTAYPAVELLCLIGLQRFRPWPLGGRRYEYDTWTLPLPVSCAAAAACGVVRSGEPRRFRFEMIFRTDHRDQKAFAAATAVEAKERQ